MRQKYVLEHCGVHVTGTFLVSINNKYVFNGELDLQELFYVLDVSDEVAIEILNVEGNLAIAERVLSDEAEPDYDLDYRCSDPYDCSFF